MTGSDERDDVDDVTLWAGRLRPWPAAPVSAEADLNGAADDEIDDETVLSQSTVEDATGRSTGLLDDDTVLSQSTVDDATLRSPVRPSDTTATSADEDGAREGDGLDGDLDEQTAATTRRRPSARPADASGITAGRGSDSTATTRVASDDALDGGASDGEAPDGDVLDGDVPDDDTAVGARASARGVVTPVDDDTAPRAGAAEPPARRSALRRAAEDPIVGDAARRQARSPGVDDLRRYTPRADEAVRVPRAEKPVRADAGAAATVVPRSARRGAARLLIVGGIVTLALVGAIVTLAVLAL